MAAVEFGSSDDDFAAIEVGADEDVVFPATAAARHHETGAHSAEVRAPQEPATASDERSEVPADGGFEEELIEDRYASLDARGPFEGTGFARASHRPAPADAAAEDDLFGWSSDEFDGNESSGIDSEIDDVLPLLQEALESADAGTESSIDAHRPIPRPAAPAAWEAPLNDGASGWDYDDEPLEEQIGAAVLETCLEVQRALNERAEVRAADDLSGFDIDDSAEAELDMFEAQHFDVVRPDDHEPDSKTGATPDRSSASSRRPRQYEQLFSALRRRHRRGA